MSITNLTVQTLRQAADLKEKIESLHNQLAAILGSTATPASTPAPKAPKTKGMSAAGRAKVAAAQKARWAKIKATKPAVKAVVAVKAPVKKGGMSAAGKARIVAAQKARWAKIKAAKPAVKAVVKAPVKKSGMSAAAKAKLSALAKARWAKIKATGKKKL
jgi:hypothetical protein